MRLFSRTREIVITLKSYNKHAWSIIDWNLEKIHGIGSPRSEVKCKSSFLLVVALHSSFMLNCSVKVSKMLDLILAHLQRVSLTKVKHTLSILQIYWKYTSKMAKYLQWKIICGVATCKETLYKPRPHNAKMKNKPN